MHKVVSKETASWWDSRLRKAHAVAPGTVVMFAEIADAAYFADGVRGEWFREGAEPTEPVAAPKRRKKGGDHAEG